MKVYTGRRDRAGNCVVRVIEDGDAHELPMRLDLYNHSPTGFEWGYGGSGPAQLALALIADAINDDGMALWLHQKFKFKVVGSLPRDAPWQLTRAEIVQTLVDLCVANSFGRSML
jgi:hypothetical protein